MFVVAMNVWTCGRNRLWVWVYNSIDLDQRYVYLWTATHVLNKQINFVACKGTENTRQKLHIRRLSCTKLSVLMSHWSDSILYTSYFTVHKKFVHIGHAFVNRLCNLRSDFQVTGLTFFIQATTSNGFTNWFPFRKISSSVKISDKKTYYTYQVLCLLIYNCQYFLDEMLF